MSVVLLSYSSKDEYSRRNHLDAGKLQKKLQHRRKIPVRKLYIADLHFYHDNLNHRMVFENCREGVPYD